MQELTQICEVQLEGTSFDQHDGEVNAENRRQRFTELWNHSIHFNIDTIRREPFQTSFQKIRGIFGMREDCEIRASGLQEFQVIIHLTFLKREKKRAPFLVKIVVLKTILDVSCLTGT